MQIDQHILVRYFLSQSSEEEKEAIHNWLESDEANKKSFIRERIRFDAGILVDEKEIKAVRRFYIRPAIYKTIAIAASFLFLLGCFYMYDNYRNQQLYSTYQTIYVPAGNRTNITLPDGTSVWLNANTQFQYPLAFSKESREVKLNGEAYFEVKKGTTPFIVATDKYDIKVLGTTFNVEAYADNSDFKTILYEGSVQLYNQQNSENVILKPGETAQLVDNSLFIHSTTDVNSYRWKDGLIFIEDKSFDRIMGMFEKFYDIKIIVKNNKVKNLGYKGKLRVSDGIDHALRVLQKDFPFRYTRDEEKNIIYIN